MKILLLVLSVFSIFTSSAAQAGSSQIPNYYGKKIGFALGFSHLVVYQSPKAKFSTNRNYAYVKMVTRWGTQTYEIGEAVFSKNASGKFSFYEWQSLAMYEKCAIKADSVGFVCFTNSRITRYSPEVTASNGSNFIGTFENEIRDQRVSSSFDGVEFPERSPGYEGYETYEASAASVVY